jgi:hypothetical protein
MSVGYLLAQFANARFYPPIPGSPEDAIALQVLGESIDKLDIVKQMRAQSYNLHSDIPLHSPANAKPGWVELDVTPDKADSGRTFTQQSLAGIQGLGVQRAFWNTETRELVAVVWVGWRLSGWPGVAHGGAIATIFQDAMARMIAGPNAPIGTQALSS